MQKTDFQLTEEQLIITREVNADGSLIEVKSDHIFCNFLFGMNLLKQKYCSYFILDFGDEWCGSSKIFQENSIKFMINDSNVFNFLNKFLSFKQKIIFKFNKIDKNKIKKIKHR